MGENELLLSVMVETYNQEEYIAQTIESILNQKYSFPYEIIIGDDCSTDGTGKILDEYAKKYSQIIVIHNEKNLGAMGNFYNILSKTKGKYIMDCAGDDYWLPGKVKTQISYMEKHPNVGLCYGKAKSFFQIKEELSKKSFGGKKTKYEDLFIGNSIPALTVCYKNSLVKQYLEEIKPNEKDWKMEDIPMWLWFAKNTKIVFVNKVFGVYRVLSESESHSNDKTKQTSFSLSCKQIREYYSKLYKNDELFYEFCLYEDFNIYYKQKNFSQLVEIGKIILKLKFDIKILRKLLFSFLKKIV